MQKIIRLPQVELNLENATVVEIPVSVGVSLKEDDILMSIETQKATEELPCGESGYLRALLVAEGDEVNVHDALAVLTDEPDEDFEIPEREKVTEREKSGPAQAVASTHEVKEQPAPGKVRSVPAARKRAREMGVEIAKVVGTGPGGRITVADVERHVEYGVEPPNPGTAMGELLSPARRSLIDQMERGHREIPQISVSRLMEVTPLGKEAADVTFTSSLVFRLARALAKHEALRSVLADGRLCVEPVNIAIAMDTPYGLFAPVVRRADERTIQEISNAVRDYRQRAQENRLKGEELRAGPFAVTNLGMFGIDMFTPLVFAGQTAVLAVGRATDAGNGKESAWFTLAVDHRIVDGAEAARFLETAQQEIKGEAT